MNISGPFGEIDEVGGSQPCQSSVDSIEEIVGRDVVRGLYPLTFEHSPECLCNVKMRGIRRQEEKIKTPFLPDLSHFLHIFLLLCSFALSSTTNVVFLIVRENLSRKSAMRSDVMLSVEQKP